MSRDHIVTAMIVKCFKWNQWEKQTISSSRIERVSEDATENCRRSVQEVLAAEVVSLRLGTAAWLGKPAGLSRVVAHVYGTLVAAKSKTLSMDESVEWLWSRRLASVSLYASMALNSAWNYIACSAAIHKVRLWYILWDFDFPGSARAPVVRCTACRNEAAFCLCILASTTTHKTIERSRELEWRPTINPNRFYRVTFTHAYTSMVRRSRALPTW